MRCLPLLGALLLSASSAVADDFVYLKCVTKVTVVKKDLKSNKITKKEEATETDHIMVNLTRSRTLTAKKPEWNEDKIVNGVAIIDENWSENGFTNTMKVTMQIVPPGPMTGDAIRRNDATLETFKARGMCKGIDESDFEKELKEAKS